MLEGLSDDPVGTSAWLENDETALKADRDKYADKDDTDSKKLFDAVTRIGETKEPIKFTQDTSWYNQFFINNAFSQYIDTVLFAYEMNIRGSIPNDMHYQYLFHSIKSCKRRGKWAKLDDDAEFVLLVEVFAKYNELNRQKAREYVLKMGDDKLNRFKRFVKPMALEELEQILKRFPKKTINKTKKMVKNW